MSGSTYDVTFNGGDFGEIKKTAPREWTWFIEDEKMLIDERLDTLKQSVTFYLQDEEGTRR